MAGAGGMDDSPGKRRFTADEDEPVPLTQTDEPALGDLPPFCVCVLLLLPLLFWS